MKIGIIGCADIAFKRFMPAAKKMANITVVAVAEEYNVQKLEPFCNEYGIEGMSDFAALIKRDDIDAIYVPQPPALHYKWAKEALLNGKHVLVEKPSTDSSVRSKELVDIAKERGLTLHENYMFQYHSQIGSILKMISEGEVGDVRLFKASFGFPLRAGNDFRYNKKLGGGALLDAGGYTIKLASILLGNTAQIDAAKLSSVSGFEVDMYGSAQLSNKQGQVCQICFGMDCAYQCSLEVWGNKGYLSTDRIFTAPDGFEPVVKITNSNETRTVKLESDNHFANSIKMFIAETEDKELREKMYNQIVHQASLVDRFRDLSGYVEERQ